MGNSTSSQPSTPNGRVVPAPRSDLAVGFSGDMNRQVTAQRGQNGRSPPGISVGGFKGVFRLREVSGAELQDARYGWQRMRNAIPVYVEVPDMGVSVTEYYRYVGGMLTYVVYKLHPLNPELDLNIKKRYEVPFMAGERQLVWPMEVAISGLWPSQDTVFFVNNEGGTFKIDFHELLQIEDQSIRIAVGALKKDYPDQLASALSFRPVATPKFSTYGQEDVDVPASERYTTLSGSSQADALYAALDQQYQCARPPPRQPQKRPPPRQQIIIPNCGFDNGVESVFNRRTDGDNTAFNSLRASSARPSTATPSTRARVTPTVTSRASKEDSIESSKIGGDMNSASVAKQLFRDFPKAIGDEFMACTDGALFNSDTSGRLNTAEFAQKCASDIESKVSGESMLRMAAHNCGSLNQELLASGRQTLQQGRSVVDDILERNSHDMYSL